MALDRLLNHHSQSRLDITLDLLLSDASLPKLARNYLISCKVENKSQKYLRLIRDVLSRFLSNRDPLSITRDDIRLYLLTLHESGFKPTSVHIHYRTIKTFYNWLIGEEIISKNPMQNMDPPKLPRPVILPFTLKDIGNLFTLCAGRSFLEIRNNAIFCLFLDTGIRLEEMSRLKLIDVDFDSESVNIMGKGSKGRKVRIGKSARRALLKYLLARGDDSWPELWLTEEHRPLTKNGVDILVKRYCRAAVVSGARPSAHTFRHTAAINYLRNGGDQFTLQIMLGHSSLEMTRRYVSSLGADDMFKIHQTASPLDKMLK